MVQTSGVSSYPGFELSGSSCIDSTPRPKGMEVWFEFA